VEVDIHNPDLEAPVRQSDGKINGGTGFSHAAFAAHNQKFVPDFLECTIDFRILLGMWILLTGRIRNLVHYLCHESVASFDFIQPAPGSTGGRLNKITFGLQ
jgi:hypothetical protein